MILVLDANVLIYEATSSPKLSRAARLALDDDSRLLIIPLIALLEIEHAHQRGRFAHSHREIAALFEQTGRCEIMDITRELLEYQPAGLEIHDALYVATARLLAARHPGTEVAIVTSDSAIAAAYERVVW